MISIIPRVSSPKWSWWGNSRFSKQYSSIAVERPFSDAGSYTSLTIVNSGSWRIAASRTNAWNLRLVFEEKDPWQGDDFVPSDFERSSKLYYISLDSEFGLGLRNLRLGLCVAVAHWIRRVVEIYQTRSDFQAKNSGDKQATVVG